MKNITTDEPSDVLLAASERTHIPLGRVARFHAAISGTHDFHAAAHADLLDLE